MGALVQNSMTVANTPYMLASMFWNFDAASPDAANPVLSPVASVWGAEIPLPNGGLGACGISGPPSNAPNTLGGFGVTSLVPPAGDGWNAVFGGNDFNFAPTPGVWHHLAWSINSTNFLGSGRAPCNIVFDGVPRAGIFDGPALANPMIIASGKFGLPAAGVFLDDSSGPRRVATSKSRYAWVQVWFGVQADVTDPNVLANFVTRTSTVNGEVLNPAKLVSSATAAFDSAAAPAVFGVPDYFFNGRRAQFIKNRGKAGGVSIVGTIRDYGSGPKNIPVGIPG